MHMNSLNSQFYLPALPATQSEETSAGCVSSLGTETLTGCRQVC